MKKFIFTTLALVVAVASYAWKEDYSKEVWKSIGTGTYSDCVMGNIFMNFFNTPVEVEIEESETTPGVYRVVHPWAEDLLSDPSLNYLIIDATDPEFVMIPEQLAPVGDAEYGDVFYCSFNYHAINFYIEKGYASNYEEAKEKYLTTMTVPTYGTIDEGGAIRFPTPFIASKTPEDPSSPGYEMADAKFDGYLVLPGSQLVDDWVSVGMGRMLDGFVWPVFETENPVEQEVEIKRHKEVPGVYKVVDPFVAVSEKAKYFDMIIDARDYGFIRIDECDTGIETVDFGYMSILSVSSNYCNGVDPSFANYDAMVEAHPEWADRNITLVNGKINIPKTSVLLKFQSNPTGVTTHEKQFDCYIIMPDGFDTPVNYVLDDDDSDAPVEYFNLQGVRLEQPVAGQIIIVRQGSKVYKTIVRE